jgi:hypothetical protein
MEVLSSDQVLAATLCIAIRDLAIYEALTIADSGSREILGGHQNRPVVDT